MDENNEVIEQETDEAIEVDDSMFDEGWDDDSGTETAEQEEEGESSEAPEGEEETEEPDEEPDNSDEEQDDSHEEDSTEEPKNESEEGNQLFTIKYLGNEEKLTLDQMTELAQKGRDYDHIREERDNLKSETKLSAEDKRKLAFLEDLAKRSNLTVDEQIDRTRALWLVDEEYGKGNEISETEALQRIQRERQNAKEDTEHGGVEPQSGITPEVDRFLHVYPNVKAQDIPPEVWSEMRDVYKGDLVAAYQAYEIRKLKGELADEKQKALNEKNKERSTGSRRTAGTARQKDPFDDGWSSW